MFDFLKCFYSCHGTIESIDDFIKKLIKIGIFKENIKKLPVLNSSQDIQKSSDLFIINNDLIVKYLAILPEDFLFFEACKAFN